MERGILNVCRPIVMHCAGFWDLRNCVLDEGTYGHYLAKTGEQFVLGMRRADKLSL